MTDFGLSEFGYLSEDDIIHPSEERDNNDISNVLDNLSLTPTELKLFQRSLVSSSRTKRKTSETPEEIHDDHHLHRAEGTPDYLSPDILLGKAAHGMAVDFWALGCILYEFLVGIPPFHDSTVEGIFQNILDVKMSWPDDPPLSFEARDLIEKLLQPDAAKRLNGAQITVHPFFQGSVNWQLLRASEPPFCPTLQGQDDVSYFNPRGNVLTHAPEFEIDDADHVVDDDDLEDVESPLSFRQCEDHQVELLMHQNCNNCDFSPLSRSFSFTNLTALVSAAQAEVHDDIEVSSEVRSSSAVPNPMTGGCSFVV